MQPEISWPDEGNLQQLDFNLQARSSFAGGKGRGKWLSRNRRSSVRPKPAGLELYPPLSFSVPLRAQPHARAGLAHAPRSMPMKRRLVVKPKRARSLTDIQAARISKSPTAAGKAAFFHFSGAGWAQCGQTPACLGLAAHPSRSGPLARGHGYLRAPGSRLRTGRGLVAHDGGRRALSRFRRRRRGQRARPRTPSPRRRPDRAGREALAHVQSLSVAGPGAARRATRRQATFAERVFFCNSGAEACEGAIKTARRYHYVSAAHPSAGASSRSRARSTAARSRPSRPPAIPSTWKASAPRCQVSTMCAFGDLEAVEKAIGPETAAIMVEPMQGEGGVRRSPPSRCTRCARSATAIALLLVLDEVQTGHRPHWLPLCLRARGDRARHPRRGQGARRRISRGRRARHSGGRQRHDCRARTARRSAAIRWPWRSATRSSTSCSRRAFSRPCAARRCA